MSLRALVGSIVLFLFVALPDPAGACSCMPSGPPCQNYFQVDAVFVGKVETISTVEDASDSHFRRRLVAFALERAFRGVQGNRVEVTTGMGGGDCGYDFKVGERYLVYAYRQQGVRQFATGICSRTRPIAEAAEDVKYAEQLPASGRGARVYGTVKHWERDLASGQAREYDPVAFAHVLLYSPSATLDAETDDGGRYEITDAPPGTYELRVIPPPRFSTKYLEQKLELRDPRACAVADFAVHFDGRISGVALGADGLPAGDIGLELMAPAGVGARGVIETIPAKTDHAGNFEFSEIPPGQYVLGVSLQRRMEPETVFPRTFHPGTANLSEATVITVGEGNRQELQPMKLPPPRRRREITGVVVSADGLPVPDALVSLWDGEANWRQVATGIQTEADGRFTFRVLDGLSYIARASYNLPDDPQHRQLQATAGPFIVTNDLASLRLVLTPARR